jgi:Putative homoserine kinase type II (protein kinase fold)
MHAELNNAFNRFFEGRRIVDVARITRGHINRTFLVTSEDANGGSARHIFQKFNTSVFPQAALVMDNVTRISEHVRGKLAAEADSERGSIRFLRTLDGAAALDSSELGFWRGYCYIGNAEGKNMPDSADDARAAGCAFGRFQALLADMPAPRLHETIPNFHDTRLRFKRLEDSAAKDSLCRLGGCRREFERLLELRPAALRVQEAAEAGVIRERIAHNDAKLSNVLLDAADGHPVCVIDLDTCMPGLPHHDFGDLVRSICDSEPEDSATPEKTTVNLDFYRALFDGYAEEAAAVFTDEEKALLPDAGVVLTLEVAARFLTDHLDGDKYFAIPSPGHNLIRARAQLAYAEKLIKALPQMRNI